MKSHLLALGAMVALAAGTAAPAYAEMVSPHDPQAIIGILQGLDTGPELVQPDDGDPYIKASRDGMTFLVLLMNCNDSHRDCATVQYYTGFNDRKGYSLERLNEWNRTKRFARAYRDNENDPVLEMDVDMDFSGLPRANVEESLKVWFDLMNAYRSFIYEDS